MGKIVMILNLDTKAFIYYEEGIYKAHERRSFAKGNRSRAALPPLSHYVTAPLRQGRSLKFMPRGWR